MQYEFSEAIKAALALSPGKVEGWQEGWNAAIEKAAHVAAHLWGREQDMHWGRKVADAIRRLHSPPISSRAEDFGKTL